MCPPSPHALAENFIANGHSSSLKTASPAKSVERRGVRRLESELVGRRLVRSAVDRAVFRLLIVARENEPIGRLAAAEQLGPARAGRGRGGSLCNRRRVAAAGPRRIVCRCDDAAAWGAIPRGQERRLVSLGRRNRLRSRLPGRFRAGMASAHRQRCHKPRHDKQAARFLGYGGWRGTDGVSRVRSPAPPQAAFLASRHSPIVTHESRRVIAGNGG
jgi:hypothetical protein